MVQLVMQPFARPAVLLCLLAFPLAGQSTTHEHVEGMVHPTDAADAAPVSAGQAAFGAIAEIVVRLEADPATDWSTVDIERLRLHLVDMDRVTMGSRITTTEVPGGFRATLTGDAETAASIRRMTMAHAGQMGEDPARQVVAEEVPGGARLTVVAREPGDARAVSRLRGLGAIGFMTLGNHHEPHHEALARGGDPHGAH